MKAKYPKNRKIKFVSDKNNPDKSRKTLRDADYMSESIPTKNGIYMPVPPAKPVPSEKKAPKRAKYKRKNNVQFSSRKKAKKNMEKNIRRRQKGKPIRNRFNK